MATASLTSTAAILTGTTATLMATDSFTSTAAVDTSGTHATLTVQPAAGTAVYDRRGFYVHVDRNNVTVTKASTFGGTQAPLSFPLTRDDAQSLALALLELSH